MMDWMDRRMMRKMERKFIYEIFIFQRVVNVVVFEFEILHHLLLKKEYYVVLFMMLW